MIVYSLPYLVVFRQALCLWRKETILTNKPIFLMFFLKYWPLKGLYFPDVCTRAGFQRREQLICDWVLPLSWRGVICNPNEHLLFLSLHRACVGSCKASCEYEQPVLSCFFLGLPGHTFCASSTSFPNPSTISLPLHQDCQCPGFGRSSGMFLGSCLCEM